MQKKLSIIAAAILCLFVALDGAAQLPATTVKDLKGRSIDTSKLNNGGKPFAISFFATWCKPCMRELKAINEVYADWQDETGMKMYIVSIDEAQNASKVKPLSTPKAGTTKCSLTATATFSAPWDCRWCPTFLLSTATARWSTPTRVIPTAPRAKS